MRQEDAAKFLGISLTSLKKACRMLGIQRWPYARLRNERAGDYSRHMSGGSGNGDSMSGDGGSPSDENGLDEEAGATSSSSRLPDQQNAHADPPGSSSSSQEAQAAMAHPSGAEGSSTYMSSSSRTPPRPGADGKSSSQSRGESGSGSRESAAESSQSIDANWLEWYLAGEEQESL
ncbi:hypothetical protein GUITHDRAFT_105187 [Guillardia theta CCMP2712]|nr:hypothetical protein GUITHDRAFT_105187 [Guillardia theta CCMP2712]EKX49105.1 hypothetical protein GUITHDRAFT_105187 [Guillardia theta CCMP2712]|eukprot:XP_005836085.1 hypothetical protein GUITHDRAFT_105187 [Guillardia theta CCMP2712]